MIMIGAKGVVAMKRLDTQTRSRMMSRVRSTDTKMELAVRPVLETLGFEHQPRGISGRPDFAHRKAKVAVFLDGCFWHGCPQHYRAPKSNRAFWERKINRNRARDAGITAALEAEGWRVIRVWEHDLKQLIGSNEGG